MLDREEILSLLEEAFAATQRGAAVVHDFAPDLQLLGRNGVFDSLDTMLFLDQVDQMLGERLGREFDLIDADAFARDNNPFANMRSLADYIQERLEAVSR